MESNTPKNMAESLPKANLLTLLKPYSFFIAVLVVFTLLSNGLNLVVPQIISSAIDSYTAQSFVLLDTIVQFSLVTVGIFIFTYAQSVLQTFAAERVAKDLRTQLATKISLQNYAYIQETDPSKILTHLTSDVDAVKSFVSQAISSIISSVFLIIGASVLLLLINWKLALAILGTLPIIGVAFFLIFKKIRTLFKASQESIDWLNKVINESILGSALVRIINSQQYEYEKFLAANTAAKDIGLSILRLFAGLIPVIMFVTNFGILIILCLGGHFVITGEMSLGSFTAFNSYLAILIFPILIISFMSNVIAQASASYQRIFEVLQAPHEKKTGSLKTSITGDIAVQNVSLRLGEKTILKDLSFSTKAGTKTAIIGPTAAGKTQLLSLLIGLLNPTAGTIQYNSQPLLAYEKEFLHQQIGFVFQESSIFNLSLRENIAFNTAVKEEDLQRAIQTAELQDFIETLPQKLETIVSERGTSLSGGQKQRIMLARALAINPQILLLDDFTARIDAKTEQKIVQNLEKNYPHITLISVTQKIEPVQHYDQIILLMEGEILGIGTHEELLEKSPEYVQIYHSQKSTHTYELHS
ncbi:MAG: ABC transporter ATP-binding protein [Candidatus Peregrinibacteria bacterium]